LASTHQKYVWGENRRVVQIQSKLTAWKVGPFYTGGEVGSRWKGGKGHPCRFLAPGSRGLSDRRKLRLRLRLST